MVAPEYWTGEAYVNTNMTIMICSTSSSLTNKALKAWTVLGGLTQCQTAFINISHY